MDQKRLIPNLAVGRDFGLPFNVDSIIRVCSIVDYDALVYTGGADIKPSLISEISRGKLLLGNIPRTLCAVRNPSILNDVCLKRGINFPQTIEVCKMAEVACEGRWLVKPVYGGSGHGIDFYEGGNLKEGFYLQKFVEGLPASASFLSDGKECRLLGLTEQLIGERRLGSSGFQWCGNIYPLVTTTESCQGEVMAGWGQELTEAFGLRGLFGVDFVLDAKGRPFLVEINPRYSASMELFEPYINPFLFTLHISACEGRLPEFSVQRPSRFTSKGIVYAKADVTLPDTRGWLGRRGDVPFPREKILKGSPICTVYGFGESREGCLSDLYEEADEVYEELREVDEG